MNSSSIRGRHNCDIMKQELILKNGRVINGEEIFFHGDLTSITNTRKKGLLKQKTVKDVSVVFSTDVSQINFIGVDDDELHQILSSFSPTPKEQPKAEKKPEPKNEEEEFVLNTPLSENMYV